MLQTPKRKALAILEKSLHYLNQLKSRVKWVMYQLPAADREAISFSSNTTKLIK